MVGELEVLWAVPSPTFGFELIPPIPPTPGNGVDVLLFQVGEYLGQDGGSALCADPRKTKQTDWCCERAQR